MKNSSFSTRAKFISALAGLATVATTLNACGSQEEWHPVTTEESQVLALARFNNFDIGSRPFSTELTVEGTELALQGWIDFNQHVGYATVSGEGFNPQRILWWDNLVALQENAPDADGNPELPLPVPTEEDGWQVRNFAPEFSQLDAAIALISALGADRPENPLLLQQAGALWLSEESLETDQGEITVSVYSTPPTEEALGPEDPEPTPEDAAVKLWLDDEGLMHRTEALLGNQWVTIDLETDDDAPSLPADELPQLEG